MSKETESLGRPRRNRRASYLVLIALLMVVLLGSAALAIDLAVVNLAHQQLRSAVDAAALAGASNIDGTSDGMDRARASALATSSANQVRGEPVTLAAGDVVFGEWNFENGSFTPSNEAPEVNALQIRRTVPKVPTPFAGVLMWNQSLDVDAEAVAVRPPLEPIAIADCFLPVAVPSCMVDPLQSGIGGQGVLQVQLANDSNDNAGWAHPDGANAANIRTAMQDAANGRCEGSEPVVGEGDRVPVTNGVDASVLHEVRNLLRLSAQPWQPTLWGVKPPRDEDSSLTPAQYPMSGIIQGPVPVVDGGGGACNATKFNQTMPVRRLAWGVIFDVYSGPGQHKGLQMMFDFDHDFESPGTGTGDGNVKARPPGRLVR